MAEAVRGKGLSRIRLRRPQASSGVDEWFLARARSLGVELRHLKVGNRARLFPWVKDRHEFFPVSWRKTHSLSLLGLFRISWPGRAAGTFRMYPALQVLMPLAAEHAALGWGLCLRSRTW